MLIVDCMFTGDHLELGSFEYIIKQCRRMLCVATWLNHARGWNLKTLRDMLMYTILKLCYLDQLAICNVIQAILHFITSLETISGAENNLNMQR